MKILYGEGCGSLLLDRDTSECLCWKLVSTMDGELKKTVSVSLAMREV